MSLLRAPPPEPVSLGPPSPIASVVLNAYRRRKYVGEAVRSALTQTLTLGAYEIVVIKDFADRELDEWLASLGPNVRVVTEDHPGVGAGLARGVELARGEIVLFLEDDDRFRPEKVAGVLGALAADSAAGYVRNSYVAIDSEGRSVPAWERLRPSPPASRVIRPGDAVARDLAWVYRFGPHINVSTMAFRSSVLRARLDVLRRVTGAVDSFLFAVAASSGGHLIVRSDHWNDYRLHSSLSHANLEVDNEEGMLADLRRSLVTADLMQELLQDTHGRGFVHRFVSAFRLESAVTLFLADPSERFSARQWLGLLRSAIDRRQRYLLLPWVFCLYRGIAPARAVRAYRARRSRELRSAAAARPLG